MLIKEEIFISKIEGIERMVK